MIPRLIGVNLVVLKRCVLRAGSCWWALTVLLACNASSQAIQLFEDSSSNFREVNCRVESVENGFTVDTNQQDLDALIDIDVSQTAIESPVELHFSMKTKVHGEIGEYVVYWSSEGETDWKNFRRVLFQPDGQWHRYRLPLADSGRIRAIRFAFGKQPHQLSLSDVILVPPEPWRADDGLKNDQSDLDSTKISVDDLSVTVDSSKHVYVIEDKKTGRVWRSEPVSNWLSLVGIEKQNPRSLTVKMYDRFAKAPLLGEIEVTDDRAVRFSIESASAEVPIAAASRFPPRFSTDLSDGHFVFCDRSCGVLLNQRDATYANWPLRVYGNTHCLDMPWVGLFDEKRGDGMMLLVESPADAEVAFVGHKDGLHWPEVRWLPTLDRFGYKRSVSMRFSDSGGYVALAQRYREYLRQQGRFKTLEEKSREKPLVARLKGAPSLWGDEKSAERYIRTMRPLGVERGIISNCKKPATIDWLNGLGYLTGRYDSYTDILEGKTYFQRDRVDRTAVRSRPGGSPKHGWKLRNGQQMYWRSSACWENAAQAYTPKELSKLPYNARFIDVAAAAELLEDYHPEHTLNRRQDMANRRALYETMNEYGLVIGTEHGNDWATDQVEYIEGAMSGPFWWSSWPAGYLDRPRRDQLTEDYLKYGIGYEHRVPLWELVYHDSVVTTWYWGDTAGLLYEAAPELSDRKDLFNILHGTTPLFWMNGTGYQLPEERHRMLRTFHDTCPLHEVVSFEQMLKHEFVFEDRAVQRTQFANGTTVVVNFSDEPRSCVIGQQSVVLAPRGYFATGPGLLQTRLWNNDSAQTIIRKPGYLTVEADGKRTIENVKCNGRFTAFRTGQQRWNLFVTPGSECELNIVGITGWQTGDQLRVCRMDEFGEVQEEVGKADETGIVRFQSTADSWRFVLIRDLPQPRVTAKRESPISEKPNAN